MARSETTRTSRSTRRSFEVVKKTQRYFWPEGVLNTWLLLILAVGITHIVVFAMNTQQQSQFGVGSPWVFPFGIVVGALTIALFVVFQILIISRNLIPGVMIMLCFLFFALYMTSTIGIGLILFGPGDNVNSECKNMINNRPISGASVATLAWLELNSICSGWYAVFSFALIGIFLFFFMIFFAAGVNRREEDLEQDFLADR